MIVRSKHLEWHFSGRPVLKNLSVIDEYVECIALCLYQTKNGYFMTAAMSYFTDLLALIFVYAQWYLMDYATGNELWKGLVTNFYFSTFIEIPENRTDALYQIFPVQSKCTIRGVASGGGQKFDHVICTLGTNDLLEKVFVFCYLFLIPIFGISCLYVCFTIGHLIYNYLFKKCLRCIAGLRNYNHVSLLTF